MTQTPNRIKEMQECGFSDKKIFNILLHATKLRKLKLYEIKFMEDYVTELEIKTINPPQK